MVYVVIENFKISLLNRFKFFSTCIHKIWDQEINIFAFRNSYFLAIMCDRYDTSLDKFCGIYK